jgi:hypothetical protein
VAATSVVSSGTALRARHLEQLLDQLVELGGGLDDPTQGRAIVVDRAVSGAQRDLRLAPNHGERCAERMADVGEHPAPGLIELAQGPVALLELDCALLHLALEIGARVVQLRPAPLHFGDHPVEVGRQIGKLVAAGHPNPMIQPAARDLAGAFDQGIDRRLNPAAHPERRQPGAGGGDGDHNDREQGQAPRQQTGLRSLGEAVARTNSNDPRCCATTCAAPSSNSARSRARR